MSTGEYIYTPIGELEFTIVECMSNTSSKCMFVFDIFLNKNPGIRKKLAYEYDIVTRRRGVICFHEFYRYINLAFKYDIPQTTIYIPVSNIVGLKFNIICGIKKKYEHKTNK